MRYLQVLIMLLLPIGAFSQFGFNRMDNIAVIEDNVQQKYPWVGGLDYCQYSNIDLDQDGVLDLFIFDTTCDKILTFLQKGTAGNMDFEYAPEYEKVFEAFSPELYGWVLLADYDGDGKMDLFTSLYGVSVYKNTSTVSGGLSFTLAKYAARTTYDGVPQFLYASQGDVPAIVDVDHDGDLDILSFSSLGLCVSYYRSMSQDFYGHSDSITFKTSTTCYGNFQEGMTNNAVMLDTCCFDQVTNPEFEVPDRPYFEAQDRHSGSSILGLDLDADDMTDLLIGDASYNNIQMLLNGGTLPNTNSSMDSIDPNFPSYDVPVDLPVYPATFYVDINNDNINDLIASPVTDFGSHNFKSNWYYLNNGQNNLPDFEFQGEDFLQGEMIDQGSHSLPIYFDHNGDGLLDLIVSINQRYDPGSGNHVDEIVYYENTGTASDPEFTFVTNDYLGLSSSATITDEYIYPAFGDLDGDGDEEMLVRGSFGSGPLFLFDNVAGPGNPASYSGFSLLNDVSGSAVGDDDYYFPKLLDLNRDGLLDIVLGLQNGKLRYYKNTGTVNAPAFELETDNLGGVDVSEYWTSEGMAVPEFIDVDSTYHLILGSKKGYLHYYDNIEDNLSGTFNLVDSTLEDIYLGTFSAPAIADLDGDDKLEMVVGNKRGGLVLFESASTDNVSISTYDIDFEIFPNPNEGSFYINLGESNFNIVKQSVYTLTDISGKEVQRGQITSLKTKVNCDKLSKGLYILTLTFQNQTLTEKIIVE